jgi:hypothetical protein
MRILLLNLCVVMLTTSCAADDPLPIMSPEGVKVGFAAEVTASVENVGSIPATSTTTTTTTTSTTTVPPTTTDLVIEAIRSLWPEDQWARAQSVAWCESRYLLDAVNPESSARGVFQLLAPWTRDPGSNRTVWGWEYTDSGEKLSVAASLGIAEENARYGIENITVAHTIWLRQGWQPWAASQLCWAE